MDSLLAGMALVFQPYVLAVIMAAAVFGLFVGAIPGLTATMATALLVPLTFFMDPVPAIAAVVAATAMAIFAGDIPGALLRMPGTPASAAYTDEAYLMRHKGGLELALGVNVTCSAIGGMVGVAVLALAAPRLADFALDFSSYEYFWLAVLGLTCAALVAGDSALRGLVSLILGVMIGTIGIDVVMGYPRFTFGNTNLLAGIAIIPTLIGVFAVSEILRKVARPHASLDVATPKLMRMLRGVGGTIYAYKGGVTRSSIFGALIGALPGAGADIAAWMAYAMAKRFSRTPEKFGTGHIEGIVSASSANNASLSGAYIPALVFGIPGDTITAIVIGVLMMKGITPGPMVFVTNEALVSAILVSFVLANLLLIPLGLLAIRSARYVLGVPHAILYPTILMFCILGAYAANNNLFDVWVILVVGLLAFVLEENRFPVAPFILALILGPLIEENFMQSIIKADGELLEFFSRPIATTLGLLTFAIWAAMLVLALWRQTAAWRAARSSDADSAV